MSRGARRGRLAVAHWAEADLPSASRVVGIVRDGRQVLPTAQEQLFPGDQVIVVASHSAT